MAKSCGPLRKGRTVDGKLKSNLQWPHGAFTCFSLSSCAFFFFFLGGGGGGGAGFFEVALTSSSLSLSSV